MSYYNELSEDITTEVWGILSHKVKENKDHQKQAKNSNMNLLDYTHETVDDWVNCHNYDLSNRDWIKQANESDT